MRILFLITALVFALPSMGQVEPDNYQLARSFMVKEQYHNAISILESHCKVQPNDINARYNLGLCFYATRQYNEALEEFLKVNRSRRAMASYMLAKTETALNHPEIAVRYLREHLSSPYKLPEKEILLDEDLDRLQESKAWKELWREKEWYNQYDKMLQEALYLKSNGDIPEAVNLFNELIKKGVNRSEAYQHLAEIYLESGNGKAAADAIDKAISADSRNIEALKIRIGMAIDEEDYAAAAYDCRTLLIRVPDEFDYYLVSAEMENKAGNPKRAMEDADLYISVFPDSARGYNTRGLINYQNGKYLNALASFNKALEMDKGKAAYYFNRGRTYAATKTYKYADRDFSMALDLSPSDPEIWFDKGLTDLALGMKEKACFDFRKALQYGKFEATDYIRSNCNN